MIFINRLTIFFTLSKK